MRQGRREERGIYAASTHETTGISEHFDAYELSNREAA